ASNGFAFVAIRRGAPVAYAALDRCEDDIGWLDLWIDVSAIGLRIEHALVMCVLGAARSAGLRELRFRTRPSRAEWLTPMPLGFRAAGRASFGNEPIVMYRDLDSVPSH